MDASLKRRVAVRCRERECMKVIEDKPIRILFVEDDPGYARLIREMLKEYNRAVFDSTHVKIGRASCRERV